MIKKIISFIKGKNMIDYWAWCTKSVCRETRKELEKLCKEANKLTWHTDWEIFYEEEFWGLNRYTCLECRKKVSKWTEAYKEVEKTCEQLENLLNHPNIKKFGQEELERKKELWLL